ncbi:MAG: succinate dehydrogenase flavoprotein subunit, partial [Bacillota bacterium]
SLASTGAAAGVVYTQGADYANGEFMQLHPTAISGVDKLRLMSESARAEGGRLWVYKEGKPWYFLEEMYPAYGNLVPRDIAVRAIFKVCHELGLGIDGELAVYLDLTHLSPSYLRQKLGGILDIYQKFTGDDPCTVPMKVCPAMHYSMGGLWVDEQQMTSIKGLFAAGECEYQYHGANRLGANSMLSCLYAGLVVGKASAQYTEGLEQTSLDNLLLEAQVKVAEERYQMLQERAGQEESYLLYLELGEAMSKSVSVIRENTALKQTDEKLQELSSRIKNVNLTQAGHRTLSFTRELESMLKLARVITLGALKRDESRGSHYKPEFPERDDENWLKTTRVNYSDGEPLFTYEEVDTSLLTPKARRYDV